MKVLVIPMFIAATFAFKLKHFQKHPMTSSKIFKEMIYPQSAMQCCLTCMNEMACDGVKYDGTTCSALRNVKINHGSAGSSGNIDGEAWVDSELVQPKIKSKLLVMSGIDPTPEESIKKTEIIDLEDPNKHCTSIDFPHTLTFTAGTLLGTDLPFFCGGSDGDEPRAECYVLWKREFIHATSMDHAKETTGMDLIMDGFLVLAAGYDTAATNKFEMVSLTENKAMTSLPTSVSGHCVVQALETSIIVIGGYDKAKMSPNNEEYTDATHVFDFETEAWTPGPELINGRSGHTCSRIKVGQVPYVVVFGGYYTPDTTDKVEILDLSTMSAWVQGPKMLEPGRRYSSVTNPKGNGLIISGGIYTELKDTMYEFECQDSIDNCQWTKLEQKLEYARAGHISMLIPDSLAKELCFN